MATQGVQIVVLPEKVVGVAPSYEWDVVTGFQRIATMSHVWLVVGLNQIDRTPKRNIAIVIGPDGKIVAAYAKHHPIPDLEGDYKAGTQPAIFDAPWGRTAVLISQDLDFPDVARELANRDVRVVMAPASDWSGSELIHEQMAVVRGVESGFSIARSARGGMVSATDDRGANWWRTHRCRTKTQLRRRTCRWAPAPRCIRAPTMVRSSVRDLHDPADDAARRSASGTRRECAGWGIE